MNEFKLTNDKTGKSNVLCISSDDEDFIDALRIIEDYNLPFEIHGEEHRVSSIGIEPPRPTWGNFEENPRLSFLDIEEIRMQAIKVADNFQEGYKEGTEILRNQE